MKKILIAFLCLLTSCCTFNFNVGPQPTKETKFDVNTTYSSIVKILAKDSRGQEMMSGTGFAINKDDIMTAGHVCLGIQKYQKEKILTDQIYANIYGPDGETILEFSGLKIIKIDAAKDMCVLQKHSHGLVPVKFIKDYSTVKPHGIVYIVGAPFGAFATSFEGRVIMRNDGSDQHFLLVDAASAPGNSGSPVFNSEGFVIGMLVAGIRDFNHISVCVPSYMLVNFSAKK